MKIAIQICLRQSFTIECQLQDTIGQVKHKIFNQLGIPVPQMLLLYGSRDLEDDRTISDCNISNQQTLLVRQRLSGGRIPTLKFNSLENPNELLDFYPTAPAYRIVTLGLNLEGKCQNNDCLAYNQKVWHQMGFNNSKMFKIHIEVYRAKCPLCQTILQEVYNCGFSGCTFSFKGTKKIGAELQDVREKEPVSIPTDKLLTFRDSVGDIMEWLELKIKASPLPLRFQVIRIIQK